MKNKRGIYFILVSFLFISLSLKGKSLDKVKPIGIINDVKKLNWDGLEVIWLKDDKLPLYDITVYFGDGSLSDVDVKGETEKMFSLLGKGTSKYTFKDIAEQFEFWSFSGGPSVFHEYSSYNFSGLLKDLKETMTFVCHIFKEASFPEDELKKVIKTTKLGFQSLVSNHSSLASRAFRELTMKGTPFSYPTGGKLKDLDDITSKGLKEKLKYFQTKVKKRIYISGPKEVLAVKDIFVKNCGWNGKQDYTREVQYGGKNFNSKKTELVLVTVPKANQAQIRIGRYLNLFEIKEKEELLNFMSTILGGGFTSLLNREVRIKRGLTYSIGAFAAGQKYYGRSGIMTSTRNEKISEMLKVIKSSLNMMIHNKFSKEQYNTTKNFIIGSYPFQFEKVTSFISQMVFMDHVGKSYSEFYHFTDKIKNISEKELARSAKNIFGWNKQTVLILGHKSLEKTLKKISKNLKIFSYKDFL
jgi:zinc protease